MTPRFRFFLQAAFYAALCSVQIVEATTPPKLGLEEPEAQAPQVASTVSAPASECLSEAETTAPAATFEAGKPSLPVVFPYMYGLEPASRERQLEQMLLNFQGMGISSPSLESLVNRIIDAQKAQPPSAGGLMACSTQSPVEGSFSAQDSGVAKGGGGVAADFFISALQEEPFPPFSKEIGKFISSYNRLADVSGQVLAECLNKTHGIFLYEEPPTATPGAPERKKLPLGWRYHTLPKPEAVEPFLKYAKEDSDMVGFSRI